MTPSIFADIHEYSLTANTFTQEEIEKIRLAFDKYDLNQNGTVNLIKLIFVFNLLGQSITEAEILELLNASINAATNNTTDLDSPIPSSRPSESIQSTPREGYSSNNLSSQQSLIRQGSFYPNAQGGNHNQTNSQFPPSGTARRRTSIGSVLQGMDVSQIEIPFHIFLSMLSTHRTIQEQKNSEQDLLDAFVALGGDPSTSDNIKYKKVRELCDQFELEVDLNEFLKDFASENGKIRFESFKKEMKNLAL